MDITSGAARLMMASRNFPIFIKVPSLPYPGHHFIIGTVCSDAAEGYRTGRARRTQDTYQCSAKSACSHQCAAHELGPTYLPRLTG